MRLETKATLLAVVAATSVLGLTFCFAPLLQPVKAELPANRESRRAQPVLNSTVEEGHRLFDMNCAHCHGNDARGDEGPTLYNLVLSDARIGKRIREGIKGEMPRFGGKFNDRQIQALIAYLHTLKN